MTAQGGHRLPIQLDYFLSGKAKTYSAFPVAGECTSGSIVAGTFRGLPPPMPVGTATMLRVNFRRLLKVQI
jgi:hypothetical protein